MRRTAPLVDVAVIPPIPGKGCLTYAVPEALQGRPLTGIRVRVPLGRVSRPGLVVGSATHHTREGVKPIIECLDPEPFVDAQVLQLCRWAANYYMASLPDVIASIVPAHIPGNRPVRSIRLCQELRAPEERDLQRRSPRQWQVYDVAVRGAGATVSVGTLERIPNWQDAARRLARRGVVEFVPTSVTQRDASGTTATLDPASRDALTLEQKRATDAVVADIGSARFRVFLLFGVTGSGKTNVYLEATREALAKGRSVLILTPEIGLAHEAAERARAAFANRVVLLHSGLTPGERWAAWARAGRGEGMIVVGPRSAVFAPLRRLGLVVVDEEHDPSYKQQEGIRYNGRDLAAVRAQLAKCPVVLASATPSIESFHHAVTGRYVLLEIRERPKGSALPAVSLLDVRRGGALPEQGLCSDGLRQAIEATAREGGQTLLFLNRRGFAHFVHCLMCGEPVTCTSCSVTLTLHRARRALVCHHCGLVRSADAPCGQCGAPAAVGRAAGTEQIEAALVAEFPGLRVARMDRDSTGRRGSQARLLRAWHAGEVDVLVGTQMVTKGIDNPRVTLVGVLNADISLNQPNFRAGERTFQLVSQVAGRAGRGQTPGAVLVQTLRPDHYSLRAAAAHDYQALFATEIEDRRALGYPPFRRLINVRVEAHDATTAERVARDFSACLRSRRGGAATAVEVLGPAPAPIERLRGWYRWQVLIRGTSRSAMRSAVEHGLEEIGSPRRGPRIRVVVDVDPISML